MPFNSQITRLDASALINEQIFQEIITGAIENSNVLPLMHRLPNLTTKQGKLAVLSALPQAYFVNGETGLKQTTKQAWENVYVVAEELAVVVPISEAVLADADYDIWGAVRGPLTAAFGKKIDRAILHSDSKPASWPDGMAQGAEKTLHVAYETGNLYQDIAGVDGALDLIERDGFAVSGIVARPGFKAKLRGTVDANGQPIFRTAYSNGNAGAMVYELDGNPIRFPGNGAMDITDPLAIFGDFSKAVYAIRQDLTFKLFTEGVVSDENGNIIHNLMQNDMVALRAVMRLGWALPNPVNMINGDAGTRYPFSILMPALPSSSIVSAQYNVETPVTGAAPQATHQGGEGYTAAIAWEPAGAAFEAQTAYTATVTLTAESGFKFDSNFAKSAISGLPKTNASGAASSVAVERANRAEAKIIVTYKPTAA